METLTEGKYSAFAERKLVAHGTLHSVAVELKEKFERDELPAYHVFNDATGQRVEMEMRGSLSDVLARLEIIHPISNETVTLEEPESLVRTPGRPKLGVVAREVTLLPRHWDWLNNQPGGASVALRKLVEKARKDNADIDRQRLAREACYQFMSEVAGNEYGFEEATRSLFAGDKVGFEANMKTWSADVRHYARNLAEQAFA